MPVHWEKYTREIIEGLRVRVSFPFSALVTIFPNNSIGETCYAGY